MSASPVIGDTAIYLVSHAGIAYSLDRSDLSVNWQVATGSKLLATPVLTEDKLFLAVQDGFVIALDAATGFELWRFQAEGAIRSSPVIMDDKVIFGDRSRMVYALDPVNGSLVWHAETGASVRQRPVICDDSLFLLKRDGEIAQLDARDGRLIDKFLAQIPSSGIPGRRGNTRARKTRIKLLTAFQGLLIAASPQNGMIAIHPSSGDVAWHYFSRRVVKFPHDNKGEQFCFMDGATVKNVNASDGSERWRVELKSLARLHAASERIVLASARQRLYLINKSDGSLMRSYRIGATKITGAAITGETIHVCAAIPIYEESEWLATRFGGWFFTFGRDTPEAYLAGMYEKPAMSRGLKALISTIVVVVILLFAELLLMHSPYWPDIESFFNNVYEHAKDIF